MINQEKIEMGEGFDPQIIRREKRALRRGLDVHLAEEYAEKAASVALDVIPPDLTVGIFLSLPEEIFLSQKKRKS